MLTIVRQLETLVMLCPNREYPRFKGHPQIGLLLVVNKKVVRHLPFPNDNQT